ncbi:MAG TPA: stage II sporulation protein M [Kofleriaceae bacterium]|nr:stage II sporulation protein M [Kofleriaceae bacterium]
MTQVAAYGQDANLRSVHFRREREETWRQLEDLLKRVHDKGLSGLAAEELATLPHLYRATLSSLSVARAISLDRALVEYLESLVARAYVVVYGSRERARTRVWEFLRWRFPAAVRAGRWHVVLSLLFTIAGAVAAFEMVSADSDAYYMFVDSSLAGGRDPSAPTSELRDQLYDEQDFNHGLSYFASSLFNNNSRVGILAFALGFLAGLPTLILLLQNGLMLGAFAALYHSRGLSWDLWGWLLPHGVTELLAVILCGGAGFLLAHAVVFPGSEPRVDALRRRGRQAAEIVLGSVIMLFIAGLIEGIFRQTVTSIEVRYAVACSTALFWIWYFGFCGRARQRIEGAAAWR